MGALKPLVDCKNKCINKQLAEGKSEATCNCHDFGEFAPGL
jgi:hypothetical protein